MSANNHIRGLNMYVDDRGQDIYYDVFTKNGYLINEKRAKRFNMYKNRFILVFMGAVLAVNFVFSMEVTIVLALVLLAVLEYFFRFRFLRNCTTFPDFKKGKRAVFDDHEDKRKEVLRVVLYLLFAVLVVLNAYASGFDTLMIVLSYIASAVAVVAALRSIGYIVRK